MTRCKSKLSTCSIFQWFCSNIAIVLGIAPQSRRNRRVTTKRYNRRTNKIPEVILNNNNNRSYADMNVDQQQVLCILIKNKKSIQHLLAEHASTFKDSRIIDLQELVQFIQSKTTDTIHEDVSRMTNIDQICHSTTSCASFITQSENARRLKALEFIRIFIEKNSEDFCKYLINEEHLCQQKTLAIYQMIKQFLKVVYQSEHGLKEKNIVD